MPTYKLIYFALRARAEVARIMFHQAGIEFEDERISGDAWQKYKPETPFGQLPTLSIDGKVIGQSQAINTYVAEITGLNGETPMEKAQVVMVVESVSEIFQKLAAFRYEKDEAKKAELYKATFEKAIPEYFCRMEKILSDGGSKYFAGSKVTRADITFFTLFDTLRHAKIGEGKEWFSKGATPCPRLEQLVFDVEKEPNIRAWLEKRPESSF